MTGRGQIGPSCGLADPHDDIDWSELMTHLAEYFSNGALHQGTGDRARYCVPAYYDSEPGLCTRPVISA